MFSDILGIPAHPLWVHGAVVMVPLLALFAAVYAVVPRWRAKVGWLVAGLAVIAPLAALAAKLSGDKLLAARYAAGPPEAILNHRTLGTTTFWLTLALGLATGLLLMAIGGRLSSSTDRALTELPAARASAPSGGSGKPSRAKWLRTGSQVLVLILAALTAFYVARTGDSGAANVWGRS